MANIWSEMQKNIANVDRALKEKNSVSAWTNLTLNRLLNARVFSGLRDEEKKLIVNTFSSSPAQAYSLIGKKMHISVEGDTAFYDACKKANIPGLPKEARAEISAKQIKNFLNNYVVGAVEAGRLQSADNAPLNDLAISILATAQYHAKLIQKAQPYYTKLDDYQRLVAKIEKVHSKSREEDPRTSLERNLGSLAVNFDEFKNCVKNVHLFTPDNPEEARIGGVAKDIAIEDLANSALKNAVLATRQADSALLSNAVWERLVYEPKDWRFTINKLNDRETLSFFCKPGESKEQLIARVDGYAQEMLSILPDRSVITSENRLDYASLVSTLIKGCITEGVFGFETAEERFTALAKVTCNEKVSSILSNHPEFLPEEVRDNGIIRDEQGAVVSETNQVFLFDHENKIIPVMANWWPGNNPPQWLVGGNKIPQNGRDVVEEIETRVTTDYALLPENQKVIVPDNVSYVDLSNKDVKIGNGLTYLAFQKQFQKRVARKEKEKAEKSASLPNLCSDEKFYGLCSDLNYYKQCMQEAAKNFAKYGIYIRTAPTASPHAPANPETPAPAAEPAPAEEPAPTEEPAEGNQDGQGQGDGDGQGDQNDQDGHKQGDGDGQGQGDGDGQGL